MAYIGNSPVQDETVTSAQIVDGAIVDADVNSSAAIAFSKMANLTASRLLVSDGNGDVSVSNVTSAEALLLDGGTSATSTTLAAADRLIVNDNGTIVQVALSDFETFVEGAIDTLSSAITFSSTVTVGSDGSGQDVIFYSGTSGDNLTWDSSEECLTITGTDGAQALKVADGDLVVVDKLYIYDNDGGEYISGDGTTLTITAGGASSVKLDANSRISLSNNDSGTSNTIFGYQAGASLDAGSNYNVFIGHQVADATLADATKNIGVGTFALGALTAGDGNVAIGYSAGYTLTTSSNNILIGDGAGELIAAGQTDTDGTVAIGRSALGALTSGAGNVAIGYQSGDSITSGARNLAIGYQSLTAAVDITDNVAIGYSTMSSVTNNASNYNIAIGNYVMDGYSDQSSSFNVAIGHVVMTGALDNDADYNVGIGYSALTSLTTGATNTCIGAWAGQLLTTGDNNVAIGNGTLGATGSHNVTGDNNIAIGGSALVDIDSGSDNVSIGHLSGDAMTNTANVVLIGKSAGSAINSDAANGTVAIGYQAGLNITTGNACTAVGQNALDNITVGDNNTAIGYQAIGAVDSADGNDDNTAVGSAALLSCDTAVGATALGYSAGRFQSGPSNLTGTVTNCVFLGQTTKSSGNDPTGQVVIGTNVDSVGDNTVTFGMGANIHYLSLDGSDTSWAASSSDERYKENIETSTAGLSFVNDLRPVTYNWKKEKDVPVDTPAYKEGSDEPVLGYKYGETLHGFIAQEVKATIDEHSEIKEGFKMWKLKNDGIQTLADGNLVPMLVKAVQELSQQVEDLKKKVG